MIKEFQSLALEKWKEADAEWPILKMPKLTQDTCSIVASQALCDLNRG